MTVTPNQVRSAADQVATADADASRAIEMRASVVAPVFDEPDTIEEVVVRLLRVPAIREVVLVDDGSGPATASLLERLARDPQVKLVRHARNRGKGAALRSGFAVCSEPLVVVQDADLEYAPEEIPRLLAPLVRGEADVVYGTRYHAEAAAVGGPLHRAANRLLTAWSNRLTGLSLTDMETGHKAFRRSMLEAIDIEEERFGVEPELTAKLARHGCRFVEAPVSYRPRSYAAGKKIGLRDGLRALWCVWRYARPRVCERHGRRRRSTE